MSNTIYEHIICSFYCRLNQRDREYLSAQPLIPYPDLEAILARHMEFAVHKIGIEHREARALGPKAVIRPAELRAVGIQDHDPRWIIPFLGSRETDGGDHGEFGERGWKRVEIEILEETDQAQLPRHVDEGIFAEVDEVQSDFFHNFQIVAQVVAPLRVAQIVEYNT